MLPQYKNSFLTIFVLILTKEINGAPVDQSNPFTINFHWGNNYNGDGTKILSDAPFAVKDRNARHTLNDGLSALKRTMIEAYAKQDSKQNMLLKELSNIKTHEAELTNEVSELTAEIKMLAETNAESILEHVKEENQQLQNTMKEWYANSQDNYLKLAKMLKISLDDAIVPKTSYESCDVALQINNNIDGVYRLAVPHTNLEPFDVYCMRDRAGGAAWTVIQRRTDGNTDFFRNWTDYRQGFGEVSGEYFLGLERIHQMTAAQPMELWVYLNDYEDDDRSAYYDAFAISSEEEHYTLNALGEYHGSAGDSLRNHKGHRFSTKDNGNIGCAIGFSAAWWYHNCHQSNLNGKYQDNSWVGTGIVWQSFGGYKHMLKNVHMAIRASTVHITMDTTTTTTTTTTATPTTEHLPVDDSSSEENEGTPATDDNDDEEQEEEEIWSDDSLDSTTEADQEVYDNEAEKLDALMKNLWRHVEDNDDEDNTTNADSAVDINDNTTDDNLDDNGYTTDSTNDETNENTDEDNAPDDDEAVINNHDDDEQEQEQEQENYDSIGEIDW